MVKQVIWKCRMSILNKLFSLVLLKIFTPVSAFLQSPDLEVFPSFDIYREESQSNQGRYIISALAQFKVEYVEKFCFLKRLSIAGP